MTATDYRPASSTELAEVVKDAAAARRTFRVRGRGTWLEAGHPVRATNTISLDALRGISAYRPDDLTISVGAGTTLDELDAATLPHGQWCPLLPWGDDAGTVGATAATATTGPFAERLGRPRDLVLGIECVDGTGRLIVAGGRVVKNVAGFDLTRAVIGSWGTLAVIAQLHLRLRARPIVDETWALTVPVSAGDAVRAFAHGPFAPLACMALSAADATALGLGTSTWLLRIGGNAPFVSAARAALHQLGDAVAADPKTWSHVRTRLAPPARASTWRWDELAIRMRKRFDPSRVLNPGLLGDPA